MESKEEVMKEVLVGIAVIVVLAALWGVISEYYFGNEADKLDKELGEEGDD